MTIFSKRDDEQHSGRADSRKSRRNRLFWTGASDSARLEPRTMLSLTVTTSRSLWSRSWSRRESPPAPTATSGSPRTGPARSAARRRRAW